MNEQALRFRVGVFVLSSFILLAVLITLFGGFPSVFKRQTHYTILFKDTSVAGIGPGTPVRKSGVLIGEVKSVELDNETGEVKVQIAVESPTVIRANDQAQISRGILGGDTSIEFVPQVSEEAPKEPANARSEPKDDAPGAAEESQPPPNPPPPPPPLPPGSQIRGVSQSDANKLMNDISRLVPAFERTLKNFDRLAPETERTVREFRQLARDSRDMIPPIRKTNDELFLASRYWARVGERLDVLIQANQDKVVKAIDNFNDVLFRASNVLSDENQKNLNETLKNLRAGTSNLDTISKNTDDFLKEGRQTLKRVNDSIGQADEVLNNLNRATKPMADRSAAVMHNLDEATNRLNRLLQAFEGPGTLPMLLNDPSLYNNLNQAACMVKQMMPTIERALQSLEVFADKLARHPESIGLGGVVRPGSGLNR